MKRSLFLVAITLQSVILCAQDYTNIEFIENKGQWDKQVKYKGEVANASFFIRHSGFTVLLNKQEDVDAIHDFSHNGQTATAGPGGQPLKPLSLRSHSYNVDFIGASPGIALIPDKPVETKYNYFIGNDSSRWGGGCSAFQALTLKDVYKNIDVRYYTDNGVLKYDIIARPGADISKIALKYEGADKMSIKDKQLVIQTSVGEVKESYPFSYQTSGSGRKEVSVKYVLKNNVVSFDVKGYDASATLVIDPFLIFSSFSGSTADNWGFTATYGPDGSFFGGGAVFGGGQFPTSPGAFQTSYRGGVGSLPWDIGIIKLSPDGSRRIYATYLGGRGNEQPHSLITDGAGNLYVAGRSSSDDYPTRTPRADSLGGFDIIITKLNSTGSNYIGSLRIGGTLDDGVNINPTRNGTNSLQRNYGDDGRSEVNLDDAGNVYLASTTMSSNFPIVGGYQSTIGGTQDGVLLKFNSDLSSLLFSTFIGGKGNDAAYVVSIAPSGDIYVAGGTESKPAIDNVFPGPVLGGGGNYTIAGFVSIISNNGATLKSTVAIASNGVNAVTQVYGIKFDRFGIPYITGQYTGEWTALNATYVNAGAKQFIAKLRPDLSGYFYRTFFGRADTYPNISITALLVDRCENVYVSGWGGKLGGPGGYNNSGTLNMPLTANALNYPVGGPDGSDFYFFVLKKDAASQLYGTYFGQRGGLADHVDGGTSRFDRNGIIYQAVCANCGGGAKFPTTLGAYSPTNRSSACNLGMIKLALDLAGVGSDVKPSINGVFGDSAGCVPLTVVFTDQALNAKQYSWNYGDGTGEFGPYAADTGFRQVHTFTQIGTYRVRLIATDPTSCNVSDTSYVNIRVGDMEALLSAKFAKIGDCFAFNYQFDNLSTVGGRPGGRPFTNQSFTWRFGDGSAPIIAGLNPVTHTYPGPGVYNVSLALNDSAYCNYPDSLVIPVRVATDVKAIISTPALGCAPYTAVFNNESLGGVTFEWFFGDGDTSHAIYPTHLYQNPGTYVVRLVANDPNTCNKTDTTRFTIKVYDKPTADFSVSPVPPIENTPNLFSNQSSIDAINFKWLFGDGDSLSTTSRVTVSHQYNESGTFNACLIATNLAGCPDTICKPVVTIVNAVLDVPNAFTPNSNDVNSRVGPKGFGIATLRFIIWNRWGQKVFETNSRNVGWDGKVNGVVQPMDVYAYTLDVEFTDGTKASRKGDITLIR